MDQVHEKDEKDSVGPVACGGCRHILHSWMRDAVGEREYGPTKS
jgi:hypothetical protein